MFHIGWRMRRTLGKTTSFAGPYLSCTPRAIARPSAGERIPFHGYTNMHSALVFARRVCRCCCPLVVLSDAVLLSGHSVVAAALAESGFCAAAESARM
jgi:hypothetical protein